MMRPNPQDQAGHQEELSILAQKLKFLVKICNDAESDVENRICIEMVGRELTAYAASIDQLAAKPEPPSGRTRPAPQSEPPKSKNQSASAPLDFAISD